MSTKALTWARKQRFGNLVLKALVTALASRADDRGVTWISQATLANDMGASDRHVRRLLALAERLRIITRKPRSRGARGRMSDVTSLALNVDFKLTAKDLRKAVATGQRGPVGAAIRNRTKTARATGQRCPGNIKGETYPPSQEEKTYQEAPLSPPRPRLAVVGGLALAREGGK